MARTRFIRAEREEVVTAIQRNPDKYTIPPFSFPRSFRAGVTGKWPVHDKPVELTFGTFTAVSAGEVDAVFAVMKESPGLGGTTNQSVLKVVKIPKDSLHKSFSLSNIVAPNILVPKESLFIANFVSSGHRNVVIEFFGQNVRF